MVDFEFTVEPTSHTKNLLPKRMTLILHLLSAAAGAGVFFFLDNLI